jgi:hypothetical protein
VFRRTFALIAGLCCCVAARLASAPAFQLQSNDILAFVGGSDVAAMQWNGHLEALLAVRFPGARFRNFGWEGDTVFAQRRDVGFSSTVEHVKRSGATVLLLQFGRGEALTGRESAEKFSAAYEKLALEYARVTPRIVLVTPVPFESAPAPLPDLTTHNGRLAEFASAIRRLGEKHGWRVVDVFAAVTRETSSRLTTDGWQFSARGHVLFAEAFFEQAGIGQLVSRENDVSADGKFLANKNFEAVRQLVLEKNHLWFNYWRPQNWAFLGGDRTTQPSSRDHRDPKVRWMPEEMERYGPLIRAKEDEIQIAAQKARAGR